MPTRATARRGRGPAATLAVAVVALAGCGGGDGGDRAADDAYVREANAVQRRPAPLLQSVNATYRTYSKGDLEGTKAGIELLRAESDLAGVEREVRALRPPPPARRLHELVVRTYAANVALARESRLQAAYVPRAERALRALDGLRVRLRERLGSSTDPQRQTAALREYARRLGQVRARLDRLEPSPVLTPTHDAQLRRLGRARSLALERARLDRDLRGRGPD